MARIVLSTHGSAGDLHPFIALGLRLRENGHAVSFALQEHLGKTAAGLGFPVARLSGNAVAALAPHTRQMLGSNNPLPSLRGLMRYGILPTLEANVAELRAACQGADLLVASFGQLAANIVVDLDHIPWASVAFSPATIPSDYIAPQPTPFALPASLQRFANHAAWRIGAFMLSGIVDAPVNRVRARLGLGPRREFFYRGNLSERLTCLACSPAFQSPPPDWPEFVRVTGFSFWDVPADWQPPSEWDAFLADERPLVAVTAGSIGPSLHAAFGPYFRACATAIGTLGARALVIGATAQDLGLKPAEDLLCVPYAPYSEVFPRCAAVIHHGGIGTTAQALRYGVPSLVIPWGADQYYAAGRVAQLEAGRMLPWRGLSADRVNAVLGALLSDPRYLREAHHLQAAIAREDGAAALCAAVEGALPGKSPH